ncbi:MAG: glucose-6-phosphate isomerase, partial [Acetobacteraceae bacterium]
MSDARTQALHRLRSLAARPGAQRITPLFAADPERARTFTLAAEGITLDYAKTAIDTEVRAALVAYARASGVESFLARFFAGEAVNVSEDRGAMHMALRAPAAAGYRVAVGARIEDASAMAAAERARMEAFVRAVHAGEKRAADGGPLRTILHIGIGGSDLGPRLAVEALTHLEGPVLPVHFLANVDGHAFPPAVRGLDP